MLSRVREHDVDDVRPQEVGDHDLLEEPGEDQEEGAARVDVPRVVALAELRQVLGGAHDGARDDVREEREVDRELEEASGLERASVDVDDVAHGLEGEERDPDRQRDRRHRRRHAQTDAMEEVRRVADEEPVVLEVSEGSEVGGDAERQPGSADLLALVAVDLQRHDLVDERGAGQQEDEPPIVVTVEEVRRGQDEQLPLEPLVHEDPACGQDHHEEDREGDGREEHGRRTVSHPRCWDRLLERPRPACGVAGAATSARRRPAPGRDRPTRVWVRHHARPCPRTGVAAPTLPTR